MKAFPKTREYNVSDGSEGMDLRDYFAAKAMQAMINNCDGNNFDDFVIASEAYQMADFMLKERENHG